MTVNLSSLRKLRSVVGGDDADLMELIECFVQEAPNLTEALRAAAASADTFAVKRSAHSLKSNAKDFGAPDVAELFGRLEILASDGVLPSSGDIGAACQELEAKLMSLRAILALGSV